MVTKKEEFNNIPDILKELRYLSTHHIEIGVFGEGDTKILMIARVHEFGTQIQVTEAMRGYLHSIGIHLRADTDKINIPERSFMRAGFDSRKKKIQRQGEKLLIDVLSMKTRAKPALKALGLVMSTQIQEYLTKLRTPPNHPATVQNKGSSNPLIDGGHLRQSITYKIVSD